MKAASNRRGFLNAEYGLARQVMMAGYRGGFLLGIGIIGGIVFHQLLQWHSVFMHTDRKHQIVNDGLFHLVVTCLLLMGAGIFNFLEGVIDQHLLQIHHVKPGPDQSMYDILFDRTGIAMIS
jgi:uncharacterized membrane protein